VLITGTWAKFSNGLLGRIRLTENQRLELQVAGKAWHADSSNLDHVHWSDGAGSWTRQDVSGIDERLSRSSQTRVIRTPVSSLPESSIRCDLGQGQLRSSMCEVPLGGGRMVGASSPIMTTVQDGCSSLPSGKTAPFNLMAYTTPAVVRNTSHFSLGESPKSLMANKHYYVGGSNFSGKSASNNDVTCSASPHLRASASGWLHDPNAAFMSSGARSEAASCPFISPRGGVTNSDSGSKLQLPSIHFVFHANKYETYDAMMGSTKYVPVTARFSP